MKSARSFACLSPLTLLGLFWLAPSCAAAESVTYSFSTLAGAASIGSTDGPGQLARFQAPRGVAVDRTGTVYVADTVNNTIRKITPDGIVSTLAGSPGISSLGRTDENLLPLDGTGSAAVFTNPEGIAVDAAGNLFVADKLVSLIRKVTPAGVVTTWAGKPRVGGSTDGPRDVALLYIPGGVAVDAAGNVYVAEWVDQTIRKITPDGAVSTLAGLAGAGGSSDGTGSAARFSQPMGVAVDPLGNVFVADAVNCEIRKISPDGVVTTLAGSPLSQGHVDGPTAAARFNRPNGVALDAAGNLYVCDSGNFTVRKITPAGLVTTLAGEAGVRGSSDGAGTAAHFRDPFGIAVGADGIVYVADETDNTIRKITPEGVVTTLAGLGLDGSIGSADGTGSKARFNVLASTAVGPDGAVYVADTLNATIRKITADGTVSTFAGQANVSGSVDGDRNVARFYMPFGVVVDATGTVYVADSGNNTIRKITADGTVTTLAGTAGVYGSADGTGSSAQLFYPYALALAANGTIYFTEIGNYTVRKVTPDGVVTTLAGSPGQPGNADGTGNAARFRSPESIAVDPAGNVYVADVSNNAIRLITPDGVVTTLAATAGLTGPLTVNRTGDLFIAGSTISKVSSAGAVSTLAGLPASVGSADGTGSAARFNDPQGIAVDPAGNLYVTSSTTVRKGQLADVPLIMTQPQSLAATTGDSVVFSVVASGAPTLTYQWYFNGNPISGATGSTVSFSPVRPSDVGDYTVVVTNALGSVTSSKATLSVTPAAVPPPPANPVTASGGTGGGGAPSLWFCLALAALGGARHWQACRPSARTAPMFLPSR